MLNVHGLRDLYEGNEVAKWFLDYAAQRKRGQTETRVGRVQTILRGNGHAASTHDVMGVFQALEKLNCGKFFRGRPLERSRFEWSESMITVGRVASGESEVVPPAVREMILPQVDESFPIGNLQITIHPALPMAISLLNLQ